MTYTPTGDRIFVRPDPYPEKSQAGIWLTQMDHNLDFTGTVVAVGEGPTTKAGVRLPHFVHVGDRVLFSPMSGQELFFENKTLLVLREDDVLAIIDKKQEVERGY